MEALKIILEALFYFLIGSLNSFVLGYYFYAAVSCKEYTNWTYIIVVLSLVVWAYWVAFDKLRKLK